MYRYAKEARRMDPVIFRESFFATSFEKTKAKMNIVSERVGDTFYSPLSSLRTVSTLSIPRSMSSLPIV